MMITLIYLFLLNSLLMASPSVQIKADLGEALQKYTKVTGNDKNCVEDYPELALEDDKKIPTVHLGEKFVFPSVNLLTVTEKSDDGCSFTFNTKTFKVGLESKIIYACKTGKSSYEIDQKLTYNGKLLKLSYVKTAKDPALANSFDCTYKPNKKIKK